MWARLDYLPPPLDLCCWCLALSFPVRRGGLGLSSGLWWPCGFCCFFVWYSCVCGFVPIRFSSQSPLDKLQRVLTFLMVCCLVCPEGSADLFIYFCLFLLHVADTSHVKKKSKNEEFICRSRQTLLLGGRNRRQFDWYSFECTVGKKKNYDETLKQTDLFVNRRWSEVETVKYPQEMLRTSLKQLKDMN